MPMLSIRLSDGDLVSLSREAKTLGVSLSEAARRRLRGESQDDSDVVEDLERRVSRLEEMAGL